MRIPDNYDAWCRHEDEDNRKLVKLPCCAWCGERIQDSFCYEIDGDKVCEECIADCRIKVEEVGA